MLIQKLYYYLDIQSSAHRSVINKYLCTGIFFIISGYALADEVYQYVDHDGNTVISNKSTKNAKKMNLPALKYEKNSTIQKNNPRIEILKNELEREKQALEDARSLLKQNKNLKITNNDKEQKLSKERIKTLESAINEHEKNIEILTKQLKS